jgi:hypothetical protein
VCGHGHNDNANGAGFPAPFSESVESVAGCCFDDFGICLAGITPGVHLGVGP